MPPKQRAAPTCKQTVHQCKTCPWRVTTDPAKDIPNYQEPLARGLDRTIAKSAAASFDQVLRQDPLHVMACHYSKKGAEIPCAGWLYNQLGVGNNIAVRLAVMTGRFPVPEVDGDQHSRYADTLPCDVKKDRRGR